MEKKDNILDYVPVQNCPWDKDSQGKVYLIKEKAKNKLLKKIITWAGRSQDFHIHLDELGSAAWLAADGRRSILAIAALLQQQGTGEVAQVEPRLAKFFAMLARDGFSGWKDSDK